MNFKILDKSGNWRKNIYVIKVDHANPIILLITSGECQGVHRHVNDVIMGWVL